MMVHQRCGCARYLAVIAVFSSVFDTHAFVKPCTKLPGRERVSLCHPVKRREREHLSPLLQPASQNLPTYVRSPNFRRGLSSSLLGDLAESLLSPTGNVPFPLALGINAILFSAFSPKLFTMLTATGFAHAMALGTLLWTTLGWKGWTYCVAYLLFGQLVTKVRFEDKEERTRREARRSQRTRERLVSDTSVQIESNYCLMAASRVTNSHRESNAHRGSAATGLACAACSVQGASFLGIGSDLFVLGYVASLATKLADTFASEIGKAYGKTTFLITSLQRVEPGTEGAISAEGTAAAAVGGLLLSIVGFLLGFINGPSIAISTVAAFIATNVESLLGATLQEKEGLEWITNEVINFFNTLIGASLAMAAGRIFLNM